LLGAVHHEFADAVDLRLAGEPLRIRNGPAKGARSIVGDELRDNGGERVGIFSPQNRHASVGRDRLAADAGSKVRGPEPGS
jgi:hypothetical protein